MPCWGVLGGERILGACLFSMNGWISLAKITDLGGKEIDYSVQMKTKLRGGNASFYYHAF